MMVRFLILTNHYRSIYIWNLKRKKFRLGRSNIDLNSVSYYYLTYDEILCFWNLIKNWVYNSHSILCNEGKKKNLVKENALFFIITLKIKGTLILSWHELPLGSFVTPLPSLLPILKGLFNLFRAIFLHIRPIFYPSLFSNSFYFMNFIWAHLPFS